MLTCREITDLVTEYAEGNLSLLDSIRFHMHIGMCRSCRRYVRQVKATAGALGLLPTPEMPPELELELVRRFESWKRARG
ncbi:MAG TPA: zf-HC2 domain-containing protein [Anaeromyxobacter sp.]